MKKVMDRLKFWWFMKTHLFWLNFKISFTGVLLKLETPVTDLYTQIDVPLLWDYGSLGGKSWWWYVSENKTIELQWFWQKATLNTGVEINWSMHQDHAGLRVEVSVLGLTVMFEFYDVRHRNDDTNGWEECKDS